MKILLVCFVLACVSAAPFEGALTLPGVQNGVFRLADAKPVEGTGVLGVPFTETVGTAGTNTPVVPASTALVGHIPTTVFIQRPLPVVPAPIPYLVSSTSHVAGLHAVIPPCILPGVATLALTAPLPPKAPIRETYTYVAGAGGSLLIPGGLSESHKGSLSVDPEISHDDSSVVQPAPPIAETPIVSDKPSDPAPIVPSPHSVYGVPDLYTSTTFAPPEVSSGPYPARSDVISHYGEPLQVPSSVLRQGI